MFFEDVINEEAIDALTPSQIEQIMAILEKAGYQQNKCLWVNL